MSNAHIERLSEWIDGELSPDDSEAQITAVESDPVLAALERDLRRVDTAFRRSAQAKLEAPLPSSAVTAVHDGFASRRRAAKRREIIRSVLPIAASLLIVVGGGYWLEGRITDNAAERRHDAALVIEAAVQNALETAMSGREVSLPIAGDNSSIKITPTRTYQSTSKHWCREFKEQIEQRGVLETRTGVACREIDGHWRRVGTGSGDDV